MYESRCLGTCFLWTPIDLEIPPPKMKSLLGSTPLQPRVSARGVAIAIGFKNQLDLCTQTTQKYELCC